jgi:hypothetical protein
VLTILLALFTGAGVTLGGSRLVKRSGRRKPDQRTYELILALYLIRRRVHVSQFRIEVLREAASLRRELHVELDELRRQEGGRR